MGADTITVLKRDVDIARRGTLMQLEGNSKLVEQFGSMAQALETLGMWDFIENEAQVIACERTWTRFERNIRLQQEAK